MISGLMKISFKNLQKKRRDSVGRKICLRYYLDGRLSGRDNSRIPRRRDSAGLGQGKSSWPKSGRRISKAVLEVVRSVSEARPACLPRYVAR